MIQTTQSLGAEATIRNAPELFKKSSQVYLSRVEKFFNFYCELVAKFLENPEIVRKLDAPKPNMVFSESYKKAQEKRAIKLCTQLDLKHPKIKEKQWWQNTELKIKNSAKKEEKPVKGRTQAEVEQQITELAQKVQLMQKIPTEGNKLKKPSTALPESLARPTAKGVASEVVIRKHVDNFINVTRQSAQEKEQFELEREMIRKEYEEKLEQYLQEQLLLENPPDETDSRIKIERLYQTQAPYYKKKMLKNSHALSQINIRNGKIGKFDY